VLHKILRALGYSLPMLLLIASAHAQIDPEQRRLVQIGYDQSLEGHGPIAGYAFYYLNEPGFLSTNLTLRLAVAPVYLDSELGISHALGENTDVGIGLFGGGFADSYNEIRGGHYYREESFTGDGVGASASIYHLFNPGQRIPLYGIVRGGAHFTTYERDAKTAPNFVVPDDRTTFTVRAGLRWGGREPLLTPALAMEMSVWYEGQWRSNRGIYGYGDREVEPDSQLFWCRALLAYTFEESQQNFSASVTAGTSMNADRFSAYRLGSELPLASEFPLDIPGYYSGEISASRFLQLGGYYSVPLDAAKLWSIKAFAATAVVEYIPGLEQPGDWHSGIGGGVGYRSPNKIWQVSAGYAYGLDALRSGGRGAQSIGILIQFDLEAKRHLASQNFDPTVEGDKSKFFDRVFQRWF
jgi:hypothetical protein